MVFLKCCKGCEWQGCRFEADVEQEEVARRYHEEHTEKCEHNQLVEFATANAYEVAISPLHGLKNHKECADIENAFHRPSGLALLKHTCKGDACAAWNEAESSVESERSRSEKRKPFLALGWHKSVIEKY